MQVKQVKTTSRKKADGRSARAIKPKQRSRPAPVATETPRLSTPAGDHQPGEPAAAAAIHDGAQVTGASVDSLNMLNILSHHFARLMPANQFRPRTVIADDNYLEVDPAFVRQAIVTDPVLSAQRYHANVFDCDDYVQFLKTKMSLYAATQRLRSPLAVGYIFTVVHAFSLCVGPRMQLHLINTQSADIAVTHNAATFAEFLSLAPSNYITAIYI